MKNLKKVTVLIMLFLTVLQLTAAGQFDTPTEAPVEENDQSPGAPADPNDAPIDGGLSLLLAAGAAYGVKKYRDGKPRQDKEGDGK